jgi:hypothetical protein
VVVDCTYRCIKVEMEFFSNFPTHSGVLGQSIALHGHGLAMDSRSAITFAYHLVLLNRKDVKICSWHWSPDQNRSNHILTGACRI